MERTQIIKKMIDATGMSIRAFSEVAQIPYTTLRSILERGVSNASVDNVIKICKALGITVNYLESLSKLPDSDIGWHVDIYKARINSILAHNLLNEEFLLHLSGVKGISVLDANYLMIQILLNDKINLTGVEPRSQVRLIQSIIEEMISNHESIEKNINKACFLFTIDQIKNNDYANGGLQTLTKKAKKILFDYPEFYQYIENRPELEFLLDTNNETNVLHINNNDIREIARAGKNMSSDEAAELRKFAERLFPNAFKKDS